MRGIQKCIYCEQYLQRVAMVLMLAFAGSLRTASDAKTLRDTFELSGFKDLMAFAVAMMLCRISTL